MPLIRKSPETQPPATRPEAADPLAALTAGTPQERWAAARAAPDRPDGAAALAQALKSEADPRVREAMLTGLARIGTAESAEAVIPYLRSDDANLRTGALDALRTMPRAVAPHVPALLADADADVRLLACELARGWPGPESVAVLCRLLDREAEANVVAAAIDVLAEIGSPEALPALRRCAERFRAEPFLDFAIQIAANRIGAQASGPRD